MLTRRDLSERELAAPSGIPVTSLVIRTTSGTSGGAPVMVVRGAIEWSTSPLSEPVRNILCTVGPMNHRLNQIVGCLYRTEASLERVLTPDPSDFSLLPSLIPDFKPDFLAGTTLLAPLAELFRGTDALHSVKAYVLGGWLVSAQAWDLLRELMPHALIRGVYTASETGLIGISVCGHLPRNCYHPHRGVSIRIDAPDEDGVGDIVVSKKLPSRSIESYRIGDSARAIAPCPCGNPIAFQVMGRTNFDFIKLQGTIIRQEEFDRVLDGLRTHVREYRGVVSEESIGGRLIPRIALEVIPASALGAERLADEIARSVFLTPSKTLAQLIAEGRFAPLSVTFVDSFPPQHKKNKLRLRKSEVV